MDNCNASIIVTFICIMNTTVSAGCPTLVTITPSNGAFAAGDVLTCTANGHNPTYAWTGTAGVNGAMVSETGAMYTLPKGPFDVTCTANVSQLSAPCHMSATVSGNAYSKYESNIALLLTRTLEQGPGQGQGLECEGQAPRQ